MLNLSHLRKCSTFYVDGNGINIKRSFRGLNFRFNDFLCIFKRGSLQRFLFFSDKFVFKVTSYRSLSYNLFKTGKTHKRKNEKIVKLSQKEILVVSLISNVLQWNLFLQCYSFISFRIVFQRKNTVKESFFNLTNWKITFFLSKNFTHKNLSCSKLWLDQVFSTAYCDTNLFVILKFWNNYFWKILNS